MNRKQPNCGVPGGSAIQVDVAHCTAAAVRWSTMSLVWQGSHDCSFRRKRGATVFTCDWCLQEIVDVPVVRPVQRRSAQHSEHECLCSDCADLAAVEDMHRVVVAVARVPRRVLRSTVHAAA